MSGSLSSVFFKNHQNNFGCFAVVKQKITHAPIHRISIRLIKQFIYCI